MKNILLQICGTSGSGKSHVVRSILAASERTPRFVEGRKNPIGYDVSVRGVHAPVFVVGSYETPTGGCDTINSMDLIHDLAESEWRLGRSVIFEGLLVRNFNRGLPLLQRTRAIHVLLLSTPLEVCYDSIRQRQEARGVVGKSRPKNTVNDMRSHESYFMKMRAAGATVQRVSRDEALPAALAALRGDTGE